MEELTLEEKNYYRSKMKHYCVACDIELDMNIERYVACGNYCHNCNFRTRRVAENNMSIKKADKLLEKRIEKVKKERIKAIN